MNAHILIQAVIQQSTILLAQLATAGGLRAPLSQVAGQVFLDLSSELQNNGLRKNVIADMFGMTLRTYHRKVRELSQSRSVEGKSLWEAVLDLVRAEQPVSAAQIHERFAHDEYDVVVGVLSDLVNNGLCYRAGRGFGSVYRIAEAADFGEGLERARRVANEYLVWQAVYRARPISREQLVQLLRLPDEVMDAAIEALTSEGRIEREPDGTFTSKHLDVPVGQAAGWEAAVFDHYQAMVGALCAKLAAREARSARSDLTGGATYSLDIWRGHPMEEEVLGTLQRVRTELESMRARLDAIVVAEHPPVERLVFYFGQHFKSDRETNGS